MTTLLESVLIALREHKTRFASVKKPKQPNPPPGEQMGFTVRRSNAIDQFRPYLNCSEPYDGVFNGTYLEKYGKEMDDYEEIYYLIARFKHWKSIILLIQSIYEDLRKSNECLSPSEIDNLALKNLLTHPDFPFKYDDYYKSYVYAFIDMCIDLRISYSLDSVDGFKDEIQNFITRIGKESLSDTNLIV